MSRAEKTEVQKTMKLMRERLGMSQRQLALRMNVSAITIARWESSRPPRGASVLSLVAFARTAGLHDWAVAIEQAALQDAREEYQYRIRPITAIKDALTEIRARNDDPLIAREFLKILRAIKRTHALCMEKFRPDDPIRERLQMTHGLFTKELEDEEKRTEEQTKKR